MQARATVTPYCTLDGVNAPLALWLSWQDDEGRDLSVTARADGQARVRSLGSAGEA